MFVNFIRRASLALKQEEIITLARYEAFHQYLPAAERNPVRLHCLGVKHRGGPCQSDGPDTAGYGDCEQSR